ncbi:MAG: hypothetical protein JO199_13820 [Candidatus Eremiobacteraeota bacterium]|nr:hypothetical protein [Candidatus Eremiobacteraeota bacterium]
MIPPDVAFALLINRTSAYYEANPPAYMTYTEHTRVSVASLGRAQEINRSVAVRVADNYAVMRDLPNGGTRVGQAFPIVAYFDPLSAFGFSWFANLKNVNITVERGQPLTLDIPEADPSVDSTVVYNSFWAARYAPDSTDDALHLLIDPTARVGNSYYPADVVEDPASKLPSHIRMNVNGSDESISLDYKVIDGHWVIVHGQWGGTEHAVMMTFKVLADVTFDDIAFPTEAPDPRLAGTPAPTPAPSGEPAATPEASPAATPSSGSW